MLTLSLCVVGTGSPPVVIPLTQTTTKHNTHTAGRLPTKDEMDIEEVEPPVVTLLATVVMNSKGPTTTILTTKAILGGVQIPLVD